MPFDPIKIARAAVAPATQPQQHAQTQPQPGAPRLPHDELCPCPQCETLRQLQQLNSSLSPLGLTNELLAKLVELTGADEERPDIDKGVYLAPGVSITLHRQNRRYNALLLGTAASVTVEMPGAPIITLSLSAGWNTLNAAEGSILMLPSNGTGQPAVFRATDNRP